MYIIIVGGGNVGYNLAKSLMNTDHELLILEKNRVTHRTIAEELGEVAMQGDGCEVRIMEEAGVGRADVVVAATGDDEDNLVICQMAKMKFNVPRTIARIHDPRNEALFHRLGIDSIVSSTKIIHNLIEQEIECGDVIPLAALRRGNIEILEIDLGRKSPVLDRTIGQIHLPPSALIISIIRQNEAIIPGANTVFQDGDSVIALVHADNEPEFREVFAERHGA